MTFPCLLWKWDAWVMISSRISFWKKNIGHIELVGRLKIAALEQKNSKLDMMTPYVGVRKSSSSIYALWAVNQRRTSREIIRFWRKNQIWMRVSLRCRCRHRPQRLLTKNRLLSMLSFSLGLGLSLVEFACVGSGLRQGIWSRASMRNYKQDVFNEGIFMWLPDFFWRATYCHTNFVN